MLSLPDEHELIGFFESAPKLLDADVEWAYNELRFVTVRGPDTVTVRISAADGELAIRWEKAGQQLVRMNLVNLEKLAVEMQKGDEFLIATGTHADHNFMLKLRLKPVVAIEFDEAQIW
jgi:hypothetical protein